MIEVESGTLVALAEPFPNLEPGLPGEARFDLEDEDSSTANWVNQCIESGFTFDDGLDLESLISSLSSGKVDGSNFMDGEPVDEPERPSQPATPLSPVSPASSDSSYHRSANPVPRHKRPSHKRAELKRRDKIKNRLDDLKAEVPSITDKGKMSESAILSKAAEYAKHLKGGCERFTTEAANLRQEIESLSTEIHTFQEDLPAAGLKPEVVEGQESTLDQLYKNYVAARTKESWKFYLFSFFMKPMFESYKKEAATDHLDTFMSSVTNWTKETLGLSNLRHQILEKMREISRQTDILTHPETLPEQAMASIAQMSLDTAEPLTISSRCAPEPVQSPIPSSAGSHQPAASAGQPTTSLHQLMDRHASTHASAESQSLRLPIKAPTSFASATSGHAASLHLATSSSVGLPKTFVPRMTMHSAGQHPAATSVTFSSSKDFVPAATMLTTSQHLVTSISVAPPRNFVLAMMVPAAGPRPITTISSPFVNVTHQGASMNEASAGVSRPTAIMAPSMSVSNISDHPTSSVISLVTGTHCHEYDFDIADPLPDLPDVATPSPQPFVSSSSPFTNISLLTPIEAYPRPSGNLPHSQPTSTILTASHSSFIAQPAASMADPSVNKAFSPCSTSWS